MKTPKKVKIEVEGLQVDVDGNSPLHLETDPDKVRALIAAGANLEARNLERQTPLLRAAEAGPNGPSSKVEILLEAGADISARDTWEHCALEHVESEEIADILIRWGILKHLRREELADIMPEDGSPTFAVARKAIKKEIRRKKEEAIKSLRKNPTSTETPMEI
jgi:hypothetical protein